MRLYYSKRHSPLVSNNIDGATRYLETCDFKLRSANGRALALFLGTIVLTILFFVLKFFLF